MMSLVKISVVFVLLIFPIVVFQSCGSQTEEKVQNYPTGEISRMHTEIKGKKEGKMIEYYKDGSVKSERFFENDIQVGKSTIFYPSGKIKENQYYQDGKLTGGDTVFYENGKPQFMRNWTKGVLDGYIRKWDENDAVIYEAKYSNDTLVEVKGEVLHPDTIPQK